MKRIYKKLVISLFAVIAALITLGTSTYAWFSIGSSAKVKGMEVSATADSVFLQIAKDSNGTYGIDVDFTSSSAQSLLPIAHQDSDGNYIWYYGYSDLSSSATMNTNSTRIVSNAMELSDKYYYHKTIWVKTGTDNSAENLYISEITLIDSDNTVKEALKVLVVCENNRHEFEYTDIKNGNVKATTSDGVLDSSSLTNYLLANEVTQNPTAIDIYIYFDGNNANLKSDNANKLDSSLKINVKFAVEGAK